MFFCKKKNRPKGRLVYSGGADQARTDETVMVAGQESLRKLKKKRTAQKDGLRILVELIRLELTRR